MTIYSCVIFDLDGTLLDTREGVISSMRYMLERLGLPQLREETLSTFIGPPLKQSLMRYFSVDESTVINGSGIFRERYLAEDLFKAKPYQGIMELLQSLHKHKIKIAVATYKGHEHATKILDHFGMDAYCTFIKGTDDQSELTKADIIQCCIDKLNIQDLSQAVYVGDTESDAVAAKNVGLPFIGCTYGFGFRTEKEMSSYDYVGVAGSGNELLNLLTSDGE